MKSLVGLKIQKVYINMDKTILIYQTHYITIGYLTDRDCVFHQSWGIDMIFDKTVLSIVNQKVTNKKHSTNCFEIITKGLFHCKIEVRNKYKKNCTCLVHEVTGPFIFDGLREITYDFE